MDSKRLAKETTEQKQTYIYKEKQNKKTLIIAKGEGHGTNFQF